MTPIIDSLADVAGRYDVLFCDLWGCVHDGVAALPDAVAALRAYRAGGGVVVLVTNAPRPRASVTAQIAALGVPRDCWDDIATSGDSARTAMHAGAVGTAVWFIGQRHDEAFFAADDLPGPVADIRRVPLAQAEGIVACGPFDPLADPALLRPEFQQARGRGLPMLCANPDVVVDRGHRREWCAGALAQIYADLGGTVLMYGKPHAPIYDLARQRLAARGIVTDDARTLAIGDGIATDIAGGLGEGLDTLFVTGGLAAAETGTPTTPGAHPDQALLDAYLAERHLSASYAIGFLR